MSLRIVPVTRADAKRFIARHHRHNDPSIQCVFQVGVADDEKLVGVAMVGIPKARLLMDGKTLEVTRICTDGSRNANSMLYGACARAAAALGWTRLLTYTLPDESGASLRAAGWTADQELRVSDVSRWRTQNGGKEAVDLFGNERIPSGPKRRWWKQLRAA